MGYQPYRRGERLSTLFKDELSNIILFKLKDPRISGLTITNVWVSDDLTIAKVGYYVREEGRREEVAQGLKSASAFIRRNLLKNLRIKRIPEINFIHDDFFVERIITPDED